MTVEAPKCSRSEETMAAIRYQLCFFVAQEQRITDDMNGTIEIVDSRVVVDLVSFCDGFSVISAMTYGQIEIHS